VSGFPRWIKRDCSYHPKERNTSLLWATTRADTSPIVSMPNAPSAEQTTHAEQSVSHRRSSDREMPASGSGHGCGAFVERSQVVPRRKVPKGNVTRGGVA